MGEKKHNYLSGPNVRAVMGLWFQDVSRAVGDYIRIHRPVIRPVYIQLIFSQPETGLLAVISSKYIDHIDPG